MGSWTPRGVRPEERCERWAPGASGGVAGTQAIKASRRRRSWAVQYRDGPRCRFSPILEYHVFLLVPRFS